MNKLFTSLVAGALCLAVAVPSIAQEGKLYGKKFKTDQALAAEDLSAQMAGEERMENVVLSGEISEVCQAEGCWMRLTNSAGNDIFVKFKDHAFLIPKDLAGREAYVFGNAIRKVVSVEDQRHFAEDAGKSEDELATITEPKEELRIEATGVIIK